MQQDDRYYKRVSTKEYQEQLFKDWNNLANSLKELSVIVQNPIEGIEGAKVADMLEEHNAGYNEVLKKIECLQARVVEFLKSRAIVQQ